MKKEQIANFNYRALIVMVRSNELLKKEFEQYRYDINDIFVNIDSPFLGNLNAGFKAALLKLYRDHIEGNVNLETEFEKLCKEYPQINKRNYLREISELEEDIAIDIKVELKRLNRTISRNDDNPIEFFSYVTTLDIEEIHADGGVNNGSLLETNTDIAKMISENKINIYDAIALLEQLSLLEK